MSSSNPMHDLLETRCGACGFTIKGLPEARAQAERRCRMCGLPVVSLRSNLSVSRRLPLGMGLLMGAFAASLDASPLLAPDQPPVPGFARGGPVRAPRALGPVPRA